MTTHQRDRLFDVLMEGMDVGLIGETAYREIADMVTRELDGLEPILDELLDSAFRSGMRFAVCINEEQIAKGARSHVPSLERTH